jgi:hypothetical protein
MHPNQANSQILTKICRKAVWQRSNAPGGVCDAQEGSATPGACENELDRKEGGEAASPIDAILIVLVYGDNANAECVGANKDPPPPIEEAPPPINEFPPPKAACSPIEFMTT